MQVSCELALDGGEALAVMPEASSLPYRRLIEDGRHAAHEVVIVDGLPDLYAVLPSLANLISNSRLDLVVPPVLISIDRENCDVLPLERVSESWFGVRNPLPERHEIDMRTAGVPERLDNDRGITEVFEPLVLQANGPDQVAVDDEYLPIDPHAAHRCEFTRDHRVLGEHRRIRRR